jgi:SAM-dependent methyltransferase
MLYRIKDAQSFKRANLLNWRANTAFWLQGQMRHIEDVGPLMRSKLIALAGGAAHDPFTVVDMGCGEGWLLRLLRTCHLEYRYIGLDFNPEFVSSLRRSNAGDSAASFEVVDFEKRLPKRLVGVADVVANCFNFFEIPRIDVAFANAVRVLRGEGTLLILTIDPLSQLIAISKDYGDLLGQLRIYERERAHVGYDKAIDIGGAASGRVYKGILYSLETYIQLAYRHRLCVVDYREIVSARHFPPQIYQLIVLQRNLGKKRQQHDG